MSDGGTPDISKIIGLIMENPHLIEEISALARGSGERTDEKSEPTAPTAAPAVAPTVRSERRGNREKLLHALKPYLSENRQKAIDSMVSIVEILETVRR